MNEAVLPKILGHVRQTSILQSTMSMLEWDQNTGLPPQAAEYRAEQLTLLAGMVHQRQIDPVLGEWLDQLDTSSAQEDPSSPARVIARCMKREIGADDCLKRSSRSYLTPRALGSRFGSSQSLAMTTNVFCRSSNGSSNLSSRRPIAWPILANRATR